jgi:hypothetical protein
MRKYPPAFCLALAFVLRGAHGQDLQAARACTRLDDDAARLSCYDAAMGVRKAAPGAATQSAPPSDAVRTDAQGNFADDGRFHTESKPSLPKNLTVQVREVTILPAGLYRLSLDNGQVWDTTQADSALAFKASDAVTISRRVFGGYEISLAGRNTSVSATRKQ